MTEQEQPAPDDARLAETAGRPLTHRVLRGKRNTAVLSGNTSAKPVRAMQDCTTPTLMKKHLQEQRVEPVEPLGPVKLLPNARFPMAPAARKGQPPTGTHPRPVALTLRRERSHTLRTNPAGKSILLAFRSPLGQQTSVRPTPTPTGREPESFLMHQRPDQRRAQRLQPPRWK